MHFLHKLIAPQSSVVIATVSLVCLSVGIRTVRAQIQEAPLPPASEAHSKTLISVPIYSAAAVAEQEQQGARYRAFIKMGDSLAAKNQWKQALDNYVKALDIGMWQPSSAYYGLAKCAAAAGDKQALIRWYRKAVYAPTPPLPGVAYDRGYSEANPTKLMQFVLLLSEAGQDDEAYRVYCHTVSGMFWRNIQGPLPLPTQEDYEAQPVQNTPEHIEAMALVILATDQESQFVTDKENEALLRRAVALAPYSSVPYFYLGDLLHYHAERRKEAKEAYLKAKRYDYTKHASIITERLRFVQ